jgi:NAD(P)-dependent dehydrogenase (short-subunit alcohol dehydrogenase family)
MHYGAGSHLDDILWEKRRWNGSQAYAETKFQDVLLAFAVARLFPGVKSNSLGPGWVPTGFRRVFLPPEASGSRSGYEGCRTTRSAARPVSQGFRDGASQIVAFFGSPQGTRVTD